MNLIHLRFGVYLFFIVLICSCKNVRLSQELIFTQKFGSKIPYRILKVKDSTYSLFFLNDPSSRRYDKVGMGTVKKLSIKNQSAFVFSDSIFFQPNIDYQAKYFGNNKGVDSLEISIMDSLLNPRHIELHLIRNYDTLVLCDLRVYKTGWYTYKFPNQYFESFYIKNSFPNSTYIKYELISNVIEIKNSTKIELYLANKGKTFYNPKFNCMSSDTAIFNKNSLMFNTFYWGEFKRK